MSIEVASRPDLLEKYIKGQVSLDYMSCIMGVSKRKITKFLYSEDFKLSNPELYNRHKTEFRKPAINQRDEVVKALDLYFKTGISLSTAAGKMNIPRALLASQFHVFDFPEEFISFLKRIIKIRERKAHRKIMDEILAVIEADCKLNNWYNNLIPGKVRAVTLMVEDIETLYLNDPSFIKYIYSYISKNTYLLSISIFNKIYSNSELYKRLDMVIEEQLALIK